MKHYYLILKVPSGSENNALQQVHDLMGEVSERCRAEEKSTVAAIKTAISRHYGHELNIRTERNGAGDIQFYRVRDIVKTVEDDHKQIALEDAQKIHKDIKIGRQITDELPPKEVAAIISNSGAVLPKIIDLDFSAEPDFINRLQAESLAQPGYSLTAIKVSEDALQPIRRGLEERGIACVAVKPDKGTFADRVVEDAVANMLRDESRTASR